MSHYLVELYSPNAGWKALSTEQRQQFTDNIQSAMRGLAASGVEILALSETDRSVDKASEHLFMGIWRFRDDRAREALLAGIKASGWYDYFDHINAAGHTGGFDSHLVALAGL